MTWHPAVRCMQEFDYNSVRNAVAQAVRRGCPAALAGQADDVAQDVLVRLLERHRREPVTEVRSDAYWKRAAYHGLIDELRRRRRLREDSLDESAEPEGSSGIPDPERGAANRELGRAIGECLDALTVQKKLAVFLKLQGHTQPESAEILGWELKRVGSAVFRGMRELRECLAEKGWAPR